MSLIIPNPAEAIRRSLPLLREASEIVIERFEEEYLLAAVIDQNLPAAMMRLLILARMTEISEMTETLHWDPVYRRLFESDEHLKMMVNNMIYYLASWGYTLPVLVPELVNMIDFQQTNSFNDGENSRTAPANHWGDFLSRNSWACVFILLKIGRVPQYNVQPVESDPDAESNDTAE